MTSFFPFSMTTRGRRGVTLVLTVTTLICLTGLFMLSSMPRTHSMQPVLAEDTTPMIRPLGTIQQKPTEQATHPPTTPSTLTTTTKKKTSRRKKTKRKKTKKQKKNAESLRRDKYLGKTSGWSVLPGGAIVHLGVAHNSHNFSYIIEEKDICKDFDKKRPKIVILVAALGTDFEYRRVIRQTWGLKELQQALNYRVVFLLAKSKNETAEQEIFKESCTHGDIVQEDFEESWKNLAKKTVMGLKWTLQQCWDADFVMKTDQDVLIRISNLLNSVKDYWGRHDNAEILMCHENRNRKVLRSDDVGNGKEKYHVPENIPGTSYPQYCAGLGYVMSMSVVKKLYQATLITPEFFIEDVYVTGICRQKANIKLKSTPHITMYPLVTAEQGICAFKDGRITSSELSVSEIRVLWEGINTKGYFCLQAIDKIPVPKNFI